MGIWKCIPKMMCITVSAQSHSISPTRSSAELLASFKKMSWNEWHMQWLSLNIHRCHSFVLLVFSKILKMVVSKNMTCVTFKTFMALIILEIIIVCIKLGLFTFVFLLNLKFNNTIRPLNTTVAPFSPSNLFYLLVCGLRTNLKPFLVYILF